MRISHGLSGRVLPAHPHQLPDELFTSWFVRTAHANGLKAQVLADRLYGKQCSFWARDQDKLAAPHILSAFAGIVGCSYEEVLAATLRPYEGTIYSSHNPYGNTLWILPIGVRHRIRDRPGQQYCPLCLVEDAIPYYRRRWRLSYYTICEIHGTQMHDCCPECQAPVAFHRLELGHKTETLPRLATACYRCGFDLARAPVWSPDALDGQSIMALRAFLVFHDIGWWFHAKEDIPSMPDYLKVVHHVVTWLTSAQGVRLLRWAEESVRGVAQPSVKYERMPFEFRPLITRHWLLVCTFWLFQDWPSRFLDGCRSVGLTKSRITRSEVMPGWFDRAAEELAVVWDHHAER
jgi:hypothetical protein